MPSNKNRDIPFMPSTIETVDFALFEWLDEILNVHTTTNKGWKKVPIYWVSPERAFHAKDNKDSRDNLGSVILPAMTLARGSIIKDLTKKGSVYGHLAAPDDEKGGALEISRIIQQDKTADFQNAQANRWHKQINFPRKSEKIVYETMTIPLPVFVNINYELEIRTEYQQQINEILTPFITKTGNINHFMVSKDGHSFESFINEDFGLDSNTANIQEEERKYSAKVKIRVLGYLIGQDKNQNNPKIAIRENRVEIRMGREKVVFGDIPEHIGKTGFYRE